MEVTISLQSIITAATVLSSLGALLGVVVWCIRFVDRDRKQSVELKTIREEQTLICYGILACLRGLKEQGCDGPVTEALAKLEKHLNLAAHREEAT